MTRRPLVLDLRYATSHYPGIGAYAVALARALLAAYPAWPWRVLVPRENDRFDLGFVPAAIRVVGQDPGPGPAQARLGADLARMQAALYFAPYLLRPWGAPCPCVLTVHDVIPLEQPESMSAFRRLVYRELVRDALRAELVLTDSHASRTEILRHFPGAKAMQVVYPPLRDAGRDEPWPAWPRPVVLAVGINKPHKGLDMLVRAIAALPSDERPVLVSAGPADARWPSVTEFAERAGIRDDVVALGMVPEARLAGLYRSATLFAFPTRQEGFGLPLLEAMALGVPAVVSDLPVLREIGEGSACYCPAGDVAAWTRTLRELLADAPARAVLARRGLERATAFTPQLAAARLGALFIALVPGLAAEASCP